MISLIIGSVMGLYAQSETNPDGSILLRHERSYGMNIHSGGWGVNYSNARFHTAFKRRKLEFELVGMKHPKEIKSVNTYVQNAKSFIFGKLNYVYVLRGGYGLQRTLNTKPLVNGVELRRIYSMGASLAFTKPVYLYVSVPDSFVSPRDQVVAERYDPSKHSAHSIKGRFSKGFDEMGFYPGIYGRAALNFEFGHSYELIRALETGIVIDAYPRAIPIMAFSDPSRFFVNFYIALSIGSRFNVK